jgi:DNA polymerase-4
MDAFFASVEQAINPALKGQLLIVGSRENKYHTVVCAASYEAKRLGIDSGMSTKDAFSICPEANFVVSDSAKYLYVSEQIFDMLKIYPCNLNHSSIDEFDLEFRHEQQIDYLAIAKEIKKRIKDRFQITCSIGIGPSWQLAKICSKIGKPDGLTLINQDNYWDMLKNMPVEKVCGIGPSLKNQLNSLGIHTCGQLIKYPKNILVNRFGKVGAWLTNCLNPEYSEIGRIIDPDNQDLPKSVSHSYTLPRETSNLKIIQAWIRLLSEMIGQRLRKLGLKSQTISLYVSNRQNMGFSRQKTFDNGIHLGIDIFIRSMAILGLKKGQKLSVRAIGISASGLKPCLQIPFLEKEKIEEILTAATDKINEKYGDWTVYPAEISQIHRESKIAELPE